LGLLSLFVCFSNPTVLGWVAAGQQMGSNGIGLAAHIGTLDQWHRELVFRGFLLSPAGLLRVGGSGDF